MASSNAEDLPPCSEATLLCDDSSMTGFYFQMASSTTCAEPNETTPHTMSEGKMGSFQQNRTKLSFRLLCYILRPRMIIHRWII